MLLILDGAGPGVRAALVPPDGTQPLAREAVRAGDLAAAAAALLAEAGIEPGRLGAVVGLVGPGSFTGLRAALALALGIADGAGIPAVAVAGAEAIAATLPGRALVAAFATGRAGRFALQLVAADGSVAPPLACDAATIALLGLPDGPIAGPAAAEVAGLLHAAGRAVEAVPMARAPDAAIVAVARARLAGRIPARPLLPLYADDLFDRPAA